MDDFTATIATLHFFFAETLPLPELLQMEWDFALAYGKQVSRSSSEEILNLYWKMCALWVHYREECDLYKDLAEEGTTEALVRKKLVEARLYNLLTIMEEEFFISNILPKKGEIR